jgi:hypothetical protein
VARIAGQHAERINGRKALITRFQKKRLNQRYADRAALKIALISGRER